MGLENAVNIPVNSGTSAKGFTAPDIVSIPNISTAKPIKIIPAFFSFSFLENIKNTTPSAANTGEKEEGFNRRTKKLLLSIPDKLKIHEVTVVPMFAPIMIPITCDNFIIPELTNPTTITVVAEEDCITAVTPAPKRTALHRLLVNRSNNRSSRPPEALDSPLPITSIP